MGRCNGETKRVFYFFIMEDGIGDLLGPELNALVSKKGLNSALREMKEDIVNELTVKIREEFRSFLEEFGRKEMKSGPLVPRAEIVASEDGVHAHHCTSAIRRQKHIVVILTVDAESDRWDRIRKHCKNE